MDNKITTPVLFLVFNRPEKTRESFEAIRNAKPTKLYIAADGPRKGRPDDIENCEKVKKIVSNIDWECEVKHLYHENNLGCSFAGKTAWDWFFSYEDEMIFIEDDAIPSKSFFIYCQELLKKYKNDERVAYIGGVNYGLTYGKASYFYSRPTPATYSMATWKRVYDLYEYEMESYNETINNKNFKKNFCSHFAYNVYKRMWNNYLQSIKIGKRLNTYDVQMLYLVHRFNMYSIYPNINMVSNIGLDYGGANNNTDPNSSFAKKFANRPRFEMTEIIHPENFNINNEFEKKMFQQRVLYNKSIYIAKYNFYIRSFLSKIFHKIFK